MLKLLKVLPNAPFIRVDNGVPSCLNKSTRTDIGAAVVLDMTISEDQSPPAANCGRMTASSPPTPATTTGTGVEFESVVIGIVLKLVPRKRKPTIETGVSELMARLPSKSSGSSVTSEK